MSQSATAAETEIDVPAGPSIWAKVGAEFIGTFMLVLFGVGAALYAATTSGVGVLGVAFAFGLAVMAGVAAFGHLSGGHFNPAVTIAMGITGRTSWVDVPMYIVAQLAGGATAAGTMFVVAARHPELQNSARAFFSKASNGYGELSPLKFDLTSGLLMEVVATAILVAVILAVTSRGAATHLAPVVIGLTLTALVAITIPMTNASLNPARSTATALFSDGSALAQVWLFWVAPIAGAVIAALVYRAVAPMADALDELDADYEDDPTDDDGNEVTDVSASDKVFGARTDTAESSSPASSTDKTATADKSDITDKS